MKRERDAILAIVKNKIAEDMAKGKPHQSNKTEYPKKLMTATFCLAAFLCISALVWGFMYDESPWTTILQLLLILVGGEACYLCTSAYLNKEKGEKRGEK